MDQYEIRVLKQNHRSSIIFESSQPNDDVAIQVAARLSSNHGYEVWKGMTCIRRQGADEALVDRDAVA